MKQESDEQPDSPNTYTQQKIVISQLPATGKQKVKIETSCTALEVMCGMKRNQLKNISIHVIITNRRRTVLMSRLLVFRLVTRYRLKLRVHGEHY